MKKLLITSFAVCFIAFGFIVFKIKKQADAKASIEYRKLVVGLEKKGYSYREANYIALAEQGYTEKDSLYEVLKNRK